MKIDVGFDRKEDPKKYDRLWRKIINKRTANIKRKLADYKYMDKRDNRPSICDYTYEELLHILSTNKCTYCGSTSNLVLDRIDNTKGHTKDNTVVACHICNSMRGSKYTMKEMKKLTPLLYKIRPIKMEIEKMKAKIEEIIDREKDR